MKFLIDMNLSPLRVFFLAEKGFAAVHWSTVGQPWAADSDNLRIRRQTTGSFSRTILDFGTLLAALRTRRPSVIQVRTQDVLPSAIGDIVLRAIQTAKLNQTSKPALSLPWTPFVTAFGCCPSERIADRPATPVLTDVSANCSEPQADLWRPAALGAGSMYEWRVIQTEGARSSSRKPTSREIRYKGGRMERPLAITP